MFSQCKKYFTKHRGAIIIILVASLVNAALGTVSPYITGSIITRISNRYPPRTIFVGCGVLLAIYLVSQLISFVVGLIRIKAEICMGEEFNSDVIFYVQDLPYAFIQKQNMAVLNQAINQDTNTVIAYCLDTLLSVLTRLASLFVLLALCFYISPSMTFVIALSALTYVAIFLKMKRPIFNVRKEFRASESIFFSKLFEQLEHIYFIKTNAIEMNFRKRLASSFDNYLKIRMKDNIIQAALSEWQGITSIIFQVIMLLMGATLVYKGKLEVGFLLTFSSYFSQLQGSVQYFLSLGASYQNAKVSQKRINDILSNPVEITGKKRIDAIFSIEANNLSFLFSDQNQMLYSSLSFSMRRGKIYCLIGDNGKGKTTLINILLGLYNDQIPLGTIKINNTDIKEVDMKWLRKMRIAYLSQENVILQDTYSDNMSLVFGTNISLDQKVFFDLCHLLNAKNINEHDIISLDTLSGGEARKVCILRTLLKNCDLLILDEPDSSLDEKSVTALMDYVADTKKDKITVVVSHNINVMKRCDEVIQL